MPENNKEIKQISADIIDAEIVSVDANINKGYLIKWEEEAKGTEIQNTTRRLPVILCLDDSGSMREDDKTRQLNQAIKKVYNEITTNGRLQYTVDIAVIAFNKGVIKAFEQLKYDENGNFTGEIPSIENPNGQIPMGKALKETYEIIKLRKEYYKQQEINYYQPIIILMTDIDEEQRGLDIDVVKQISGQLQKEQWTMEDGCNIQHFVFRTYSIGNTNAVTKLREIFNWASVTSGDIDGFWKFVYNSIEVKLQTNQNQQTTEQEPE